MADADTYPDYSRFEAEFRPTRLDNLRPELHAFIGRVMPWAYGWTMEEDDQFPGEIAYLCYGEDWPGYWVPAHDLIRQESAYG